MQPNRFIDLLVDRPLAHDVVRATTLAWVAFPLLLRRRESRQYDKTRQNGGFAFMAVFGDYFGTVQPIFCPLFCSSSHFFSGAKYSIIAFASI